jgi:hypothetical protein
LHFFESRSVIRNPASEAKNVSDEATCLHIPRPMLFSSTRKVPPGSACPGWKFPCQAPHIGY